MNEELIAKVRELVGDPTKGPAIHDLLAAEVGRIIEEMRGESFSAGTPYEKEELARRVSSYEELVEDLGRIAAVIAYWGDTTDPRLIPMAVTRLANALDRSKGTGTWLDLSLYPAVLTLYCAGLGAVLGRREALLAELLAPPTIRDGNEWKSAAMTLSPPLAIEQRLAQQLPGLERRHTLMSDHLVEVLGPWLSEFQTDQESFERAFDRFEYLLGLVAYEMSRQDRAGGWGPIGRFSWRGQYENGIEISIGADIDSLGDQWPLLRAGLFGRDLARLKESVGAWNQRVGAARGQQH